MKNNNNNTNNLLESALVLARIFYTAFKNGFEIERIEALIDSLLPDTPPEQAALPWPCEG